MRLRLLLTPSCEPVPFTYPYRLAGVLHRWLGQNDWHDNLSLYSFGWLQGGRLGKGGCTSRRGRSGRSAFTRANRWSGWCGVSFATRP